MHERKQWSNGNCYERAKRKIAVFASRVKKKETFIFDLLIFFTLLESKKKYLPWKKVYTETNKDLLKKAM